MTNIKTEKYNFISKDEMVFDKSKMDISKQRAMIKEIKLMINEQLYNEGCISEEMYSKAKELM